VPTKRPATIPAATLAVYEQLVATVPGIERQGATVPYTSLNGRMCSYLDKAGALLLRLPPEAHAAFVAKYHTTAARKPQDETGSAARAAGQRRHAWRPLCWTQPNSSSISKAWPRKISSRAWR
jgi:hypothetical protein